MEDVLASASYIIDSSRGVPVLKCEEAMHQEDDHEEHHHHEQDAHIWLSPANAKIMARNIAAGLAQTYPQYQVRIQVNLERLEQQLQDLDDYGHNRLKDLSCRELITFHDGFGYFADAFDLSILEAIEEESGREASAQELKNMIGLVREHQLPAVFTEVCGSVSAADIIAAETGAKVYSLDMAMSDGDYFSSMYHNIDTVREAMK